MSASATLVAPAADRIAHAGHRHRQVRPHGHVAGDIDSGYRGTPALVDAHEARLRDLEPQLAPELGDERRVLAHLRHEEQTGDLGVSAVRGDDRQAAVILPNLLHGGFDELVSVTTQGVRNALALR